MSEQRFCRTEPNVVGYELLQTLVWNRECKGKLKITKSDMLKRTVWTATAVLFAECAGCRPRWWPCAKGRARGRRSCKESPSAFYSKKSEWIGMGYVASQYQLCAIANLEPLFLVTTYCSKDGNFENADGNALKKANSTRKIHDLRPMHCLQVDDIWLLSFRHRAINEVH